MLRIALLFVFAVPAFAQEAKLLPSNEAKAAFLKLLDRPKINLDTAACPCPPASADLSKCGIEPDPTKPKPDSPRHLASQCSSTTRRARRTPANFATEACCPRQQRVSQSITGSAKRVVTAEW